LYESFFAATTISTLEGSSLAAAFTLVKTRRSPP